MTTIRLPKRFWEDHVDRGLWLDERLDESGETYGKDVGRLYEVELTDDDLAELLSDARHYSDVTTWASSEYIGLQSSARATVKRIEALDADDGTELAERVLEQVTEMFFGKGTTS